LRRWRVPAEPSAGYVVSKEIGALDYRCDRNRRGCSVFPDDQIEKAADCLGSDNVNNDIIAPRLAIE
jgi:hypothetical protein